MAQKVIIEKIDSAQHVMGVKCERVRCRQEATHYEIQLCTAGEVSWKSYTSLCEGHAMKAPTRRRLGTYSANGGEPFPACSARDAAEVYACMNREKRNISVVKVSGNRRAGWLFQVYVWNEGELPRIDGPLFLVKEASK